MGVSQFHPNLASNKFSPTENLVDNFARKLTYLRLSVTDFCNFRCGYCLPNGYTAHGGKRPNNELTLPEIATLLQGFAELGTQKIRLTGGEPSIRGDLANIIELANAQQGITTVAVSSNGYKLGKHIQAWQSAGLNQLNLSIDSFDSATFARMTGFDILPSLLQDIDTVLATTDIRVKINSILMGETAFDNLQHALAYVKNRPVSYRFIEFMQTTDNAQLFFQEHTRAEQIHAYLQTNGWQAQVRNLTAGPAIEYSHADYLGKIGIIEPYAPSFCGNCNRLRVSSLGKIHLCLFDSQAIDIRPFLAQQDVTGLKARLQSLMTIKPEKHFLTEQNSGLMNNLSLIGGW